MVVRRVVDGSHFELPHAGDGLFRVRTSRPRVGPARFQFHRLRLEDKSVKRIVGEREGLEVGGNIAAAGLRSRYRES
jgi:hypothetical protein